MSVECQVMNTSGSFIEAEAKVRQREGDDGLVLEADRFGASIPVLLFRLTFDQADALAVELIRQVDAAKGQGRRQVVAETKTPLPEATALELGAEARALEVRKGPGPRLRRTHEESPGS